MYIYEIILRFSSSCMPIFVSCVFVFIKNAYKVIYIKQYILAYIISQSYRNCFFDLNIRKFNIIITILSNYNNIY